MPTSPVAPIAYVVSSYPAVSHTFILREVEGLRALGFEITTVSIRQTPKDAVMSDRDRIARDSTFAILPLSKMRALRAWMRAARHPGAVLNLVRHSISEGGTDFKRVLWQLFYVAEALILFDFAERKNIRHFHAHFANVGNEVSRLAARFGNSLKPGNYVYTFTMHGPTEFFDASGHGLVTKIRDADAVSCITNYCKSQLLAIAPDAEWDKLKVNYLGTKVAPQAPTRLAASAVKIVCVGRLVEKKGQRVLVAAVAEILKRGSNVNLTLIGEGPIRAQLESDIGAYDITGNVVLAGALPFDDVEKHLDQADIFCLPSFSEGLPVAIMEAMARSIPIVTTAIAGIPELISNEIDGLVVVAADRVALISALDQLVADPDLRESLGKAGRVRVLEKFTDTAAAERMATFFAELR